jgi:ABC-2 type transport system permease protein
MTALIKKEVVEILRTHRLWSIPALFLFLGLSAPATTRFLPAILESQLQGQDVLIKLPEPSDVEAFQAYFKNMIQIGILAVILFSMGLISEEKSTGALGLVVTKPVRRSAVLLSKWLVHGSWLTSSIVLGAGSCYLYTLALFGEANLTRFTLANLVFGVYMLLMFTLTIAASAIFSKPIGAGGGALGAFFALSLLPSLSSWLRETSPGALGSLAVTGLSETLNLADAIVPASASVFLAALALIGAGISFKRQEL